MFIRFTAKTQRLIAIGLAFGAFGLSSAPGYANEALKHIDHVAKHWSDTPDKKGLLTIATTEAGVISQHAGFAASDLADLSSMKLHTKHVLHALAPQIEPKGPGTGYGLIRSAEGVATHAELASDSEDASDVVRVSGIMIASVGRNTLQRAEEALQVAQQILKSETATTAAQLVKQLFHLSNTLFPGEDIDNDGRIVWYHHEGGLDIANEQILVIQGSAAE